MSVSDDPSESTYRVLLFAQLKEETGRSLVEVKAKSKSLTARSLVDRICRDYPRIEPFRRVVRVAANHEYVSGEAILNPGDEIALITPVSGG
jgi:molybdopterin converting factor subunit 1